MPFNLFKFISRLKVRKRYINEKEAVYKIMRPIMDKQSAAIGVPVHWLDTCYVAARTVTVTYYERNGRLEFQLYNRQGQPVAGAEASPAEDQPDCLLLHRFDVYEGMNDYHATMIVLVRGIKSVAKVKGFTSLEGQANRSYKDLFLLPDSNRMVKDPFFFFIPFSGMGIRIERISNARRIKYEKSIRRKFKL